ncbi:MAG: ABC transporter ATP-binding protein [Bacillota bacterium]|nr:ABC transporter ATP-binding protein [Bacillota bacterium]HOB90357.1 ABC transporter ATP-binding protein [Bacillota bacterium]HPZ53903.1 ABC transporter ATP-binding protein [Bacillota bacterium]HQD17412.1 ABC transporter ATP-binding protein [Bacillota bacterium]
MAIGVGVVVEDVTKQFRGDSGSLLVLDRVSLYCRSGEFVSVLGPSGAGKTTLLRLIAGLDHPETGRVVYVDDSSDRVDRSRVRIGMVFQEPRLLPWASVFANVSYGLQDAANKITRSERKRMTSDMIERLGLGAFSSYLPHQISGGMAQRVALGRALVGDPDLLLLDEPLGSLDIKNRLAIQDLLVEIAGSGSPHPCACIMVTHSIDEAIYLSDRIYVLSERPASVLAEIDVPITRPRDRVYSDFSEVRRQVIEALGVSPSE